MNQRLSDGKNDASIQRHEVITDTHCSTWPDRSSGEHEFHVWQARLHLSGHLHPTAPSVAEAMQKETRCRVSSLGPQQDRVQNAWHRHDAVVEIASFGFESHSYCKRFLMRSFAVRVYANFPFRRFRRSLTCSNAAIQSRCEPARAVKQTRITLANFISISTITAHHTAGVTCRATSAR